MWPGSQGSLRFPFIWTGTVKGKPLLCCLLAFFLRAPTGKEGKGRFSCWGLVWPAKAQHFRFFFWGWDFSHHQFVSFAMSLWKTNLSGQGSPLKNRVQHHVLHSNSMASMHTDKSCVWTIHTNWLINPRSVHGKFLAPCRGQALSTELLPDIIRGSAYMNSGRLDRIPFFWGGTEGMSCHLLLFCTQANLSKGASCPLFGFHSESMWQIVASQESSQSLLHGCIVFAANCFSAWPQIDKSIVWILMRVHIRNSVIVSFLCDKWFEAEL